MSKILYSTTISILSTVPIETEWGSSVESKEIATEGIVASIVETNSVRTSSDGARKYVVNSVVGQVPYGTPIGDNDRIVDESNGCVYRVRSATESTTPFFRGPTLLTLERVEA